MLTDLYNENCIKVLQEMDEESIDLIVSDPPYKMTSRGNSGNAGGMIKKKEVNSGNVFEFNDTPVTEWAKEFYRVLKDGSHCYIMTNHVNLIEFLNVLTDVGFHFVKSLIWMKDNKIMGHSYMSQFEYVLFFRKGSFKKINNCGTSDIMQFDNNKLKDPNGGNLHDTEKPVDLLEALIGNSSNEGDIVMDPFMGIGSAGIASKKLERNFIGCELDKKYFKVATDRIHNTILVDDLFEEE